MELIWHGHSFFEIKSKINQGKITIAIDPFLGKIGLKPPRKIEADILIISHQHCDHSNKEIIKGEPFLIEEPGEYEIKDVRVKGIPSSYGKVEGKERGLNTIFVIDVEGVKICHMGDFSESELSPSQLEDIFGAGVLLIPVGGNFTISGKEAVKIISQVEPKIVVPMHYKIPGIKLDLEDEKPFLKAIGIKEKEKIKKLKIKKGELQKDETEVVLLEKI